MVHLLKKLIADVEKGSTEAQSEERNSQKQRGECMIETSARRADKVKETCRASPTHCAGTGLLRNEGRTWATCRSPQLPFERRNNRDFEKSEEELLDVIDTLARATATLERVMKAVALMVRLKRVGSVFETLSVMAQSSFKNSKDVVNAFSGSQPADSRQTETKASHTFQLLQLTRCSSKHSIG